MITPRDVKAVGVSAGLDMVAIFLEILDESLKVHVYRIGRGLLEEPTRDVMAIQMNVHTVRPFVNLRCIEGTSDRS